MSWLGGPLDVDGLAVDAVRAALDAAAAESAVPRPEAEQVQARRLGEAASAARPAAGVRVLDLADAQPREALPAGADVLLTGYRPGALDRFGLADRHPHLVRVSLSAWGTSGPWAAARGSTRWCRSRAGSPPPARRPTARRACCPRRRSTTAPGTRWPRPRCADPHAWSH